MAHILVIEDNDQVRFSLLTAFQAMGHDARGALDGIEGVEKCAAERFDVVFCDLIMPRKDGAETIRELKTAHRDLKVVAMSGGGQDLDALDMRDKTGADAAITKPFSLDELRTCLTQVLG
ncbi:MAG: response regulator [Alphaproteobacteria bacterium]|nr:response regulator [Alphaproteobacteria bacterium]